ncbi:notchless protein homolog 1-like, partial [Python bivittatus]|uniref:Notchless protein homolog 1-like n=1 Tax=Python bivittatus TaxID=176946 RepID=A0A9F5J2Q5_PYTBI
GTVGLLTLLTRGCPWSLPYLGSVSLRVCLPRYLASGSGDTTVRFWDLNTETPHFTAKGHRHWVLSIAWSPDGRKLASGCKNGQILLWDPSTGTQMGRILVGHSKWITSLCWEPLHLNPECRYLASSSKDGSVRIWDTVAGRCDKILTSHTQSVTCLRWGGDGLLYSSSQDRTIKVWRAQDVSRPESWGVGQRMHFMNTIKNQLAPFFLFPRLCVVLLW